MLIRETETQALKPVIPIIQRSPVVKKQASVSPREKTRKVTAALTPPPDKHASAYQISAPVIYIDKKGGL